MNLKEITDLTAAEKLRGAQVYTIVRPRPETIFYEDIIGKEVLDRGKNIGTITNILHTPVHDVLVIKPDTSTPLSVREILVPYIDKFVLNISDRIEVDLRDLVE